MASEPEVVSWLRLERYALGEGSAEERAEVARAIEGDTKTRCCYERIERERSRALPPLEFVLPATRKSSSRSRAIASRLMKSAWVLPVAAVLFGVYVGLERSVDDPEEARTMRSDDGVKGDTVMLSLVRESGGRQDLDPRGFSSGDRFKVRLTCETASAGRLVVLVVQGEKVAAPFGRVPLPDCGNRVILPGAFSLTGSLSASVCVLDVSHSPWPEGEFPEARDVVDRAITCHEIEPSQGQ